MVGQDSWTKVTEVKVVVDRSFSHNSVCTILLLFHNPIGLHSP